MFGGGLLPSRNESSSSGPPLMRLPTVVSDGCCRSGDRPARAKSWSSQLLAPFASLPSRSAPSGAGAATS
eukprot:10560708-Alexandrium_andersonii.AAC.1